MDLCTTKQAADQLGVTSRTVLLWSESGILKSWKTPGGHRRFSQKEVDELSIKLAEDDTQNAEPVEQKKITLLVAEDDAHLLNLYTIHISMWDLPIEFIEAKDGYDTLYKAGLHKPDLIILDLNLPKVDGFQILATLVKNKQIKFENIIVATGLSDQDIEKNIINIKDLTILKKPIDFEKLKKIIVKKIDEKNIA